MARVKDYAKITDQDLKLKQLGYDVHMIFANTSLDTALKRNAKRERTVLTDVATRSWNAVQSNIGKFGQYFRQNFVVVDNNDADEDVLTPVFKQIRGLLRKPVKIPIAKEWVTQEMKRRGITRRPKVSKITALTNLSPPVII